MYWLIGANSRPPRQILYTAYSIGLKVKLPSLRFRTSDVSEPGPAHQEVLLSQQLVAKYVVKEAIITVQND